MKTNHPPRLEQFCENCFFSVDLDPVDTEGRVVFECRRSAPPASIGLAGTLSFTGYWPEVDGLDWCGEWAPMEVQA
jgi:hypothetical protein